MKYSSKDLKFIMEFSRNFIDPTIVKAIMMDVYPKENFKIMINKDMETAATRYDKKDDMHFVYIGTNYEDHTGLETDDSIKNFVQALFFHEIGHTIFTQKDLKSISEKCAKNSIPFSLLNLAEDARIEYLVKRKIYDSIGVKYNFGWEEWLETPSEHADMSPEEILYAIVNTENTRPIFAIKAKKVFEFYEGFLKAKDTDEVVDILVKWLEVFHKNNPNSLSQSMKSLEDAMKDGFKQDEADGHPKQEKDCADANQGGYPEEEKGSDPRPKQKAGSSLKNRNVSDMQESLDLASSPSAVAELDENSIDYDEIKGNLESNTPFRVDTSFNSCIVDECSNTGLIFNREANRAGGFYANDIREIQKMLKSLEKEKKKQIETRKISKSFNHKAMAFATTAYNTHKLYKEESKTKKPIGKNIVFVVDLSSSMGGAPSDSQRTILLAANFLASKEKKMVISVIGSKVSGNKSLYQTVVLPANEEDLIHCTANGGSEGIKYAIDSNSKLFKGADLAIFITDGNVHDGEISYEHIHKMLPSSGVSIGLYVGPTSIPNKNMEKWFDYTVINSSLLESMKAVVNFINSPVLKKKDKRISSSAVSSHESRGRSR